MKEFYKGTMTPNRIRKKKKKALSKKISSKNKNTTCANLAMLWKPLFSLRETAHARALKLQLNCSNLRLSGEQRAVGALWRACLPHLMLFSQGLNEFL